MVRFKVRFGKRFHKKKERKTANESAQNGTVRYTKNARVRHGHGVKFGPRTVLRLKKL